MDVVRLVGAIQPIQRLIVLAETVVHQGSRVMRYISFARNSFQRVQYLASLTNPSQLRQQVAPEPDRLAIPTAELPGLLQCIECQIATAQLLAGLRELVVADPEFRIEDIGSPRELDGSRVVACVEGDLSGKRTMHEIERVQLARALRGRQGRFVPPHVRQNDRSEEHTS